MSTSNEITTAFETGRTYFCRSIGDHNCIWSFEIVRRTAKSVWIREEGEAEVKRRKIKTWRGVESFEPFGSYSMSPSVSADRVVGEEPPKKHPFRLVPPAPAVNPHVDFLSSVLGD